MGDKPTRGPIKFAARFTAMIGSDADSEVNIYISDDASGVRVAELRVPLAVFATAVLGARGDVPCAGTLYDARFVGSKVEIKHEWVGADGVSGRDKGAARSRVGEFERDGWRGSDYDFGNMHRWDSKRDAYRVGYRRYVDPETGEPII